MCIAKPGFRLEFLCSLLLVSVFLLPALVCQPRCSFWSFVALCCFSLLFIAVLVLSSFSWLFMSDTFHWSRIGANE